MSDIETTSVLARGTMSKTVASASLSNAGNSINGTLIVDSVINESGTVAMRHLEYSNRNLNSVIVTNSGSGDTTLISEGVTDIFLSSLHHIDHTGRVAYDGARYANGNQDLLILAGPSPATDFVVAGGDSIGANVSQDNNLHILDVASPPAGLSDQRVILFRYQFAVNEPARSSRVGYAIAARSGSRWVNPAGGAWTTPTNWSTGAQPSLASETLFDLEASYLVNLDAFSSGRMRIENGTVGFRGASMTLSGPLEIGGDAALLLPEGTLSASEIAVGSIAPLDPANAVIAKLNVSGAGSVLSTTGVTRIGALGDADLRVNAAVLETAETHIGAGAAGTVTIEQRPSSWLSGALTVGEGHTATLNLLSKSSSTSIGPVVLGAGAAPVASPASVRVSTDSVWLISGTVILGERMPTTLLIENGALVAGTRQRPEDGFGQRGKLRREGESKRVWHQPEWPKHFGRRWRSTTWAGRSAC